MKTNIFLLIVLGWFLSLQAFANSEQVNGGKGNAEGGSGYSSSTGSSGAYASDAQQEVAKAKACIAEVESKSKATWPDKFMELRQKWITTELACAPAMKMSKPGYACIGGTPDASGNVPCVQKINTPSTPYYGSNGQYEAFLKTHHNLVVKAQSLLTRDVDSEGANHAARFRSEINSTNCSSKLPEYERAMTYTGDELQWHIAYELKKEGKCSTGPSKPPIILEERTERVRAATAKFSRNRGLAALTGPRVAPATAAVVSRNDLPLAAAGVRCEKPNYEDVATKFQNTRAWMYGYANRCQNIAGVREGWANYANIYKQLDRSLQSSYNSYMQAQGKPARAFTPESETAAFNIHSNTSVTSVDDCAQNRGTFNQISSLTAQDYLERLKSSSCTDSTVRQASNTPTS